jgi:hypothetical protein
MTDPDYDTFEMDCNVAQHNIVRYWTPDKNNSRVTGTAGLKNGMFCLCS